MKELLKIQDVMRLLNISRSGVFRMVDRGELEVIKIGRNARYKPEQIEKIMGRKLE